MFYMRDRLQDNENISDNNDNVSVFKNAQESHIIDIVDKVHSFLYEHTLKDDEISNEEIKEDGPMITVDVNSSVIWSKKKTNAEYMPSINILKYVFEANKNQNKSKFGFGVNCAYSYFFKSSDHFVIPCHLSLFTEICYNLFIESTVEPMVFWSLYLQSITYKNAFMGYFTARDIGLGNYRYNEEAGCLMSINHYLSLILYSVCELFQNEFKKYTIRMNDETDDEFYVRNSYVAHWQRYLYESVYFFGSKFPSNSSVVYCGINIPLLFDSYEQMISAPLSTTTNERIAFKFTENEGIILELQRKDEQSSRYFPLEYISPYAEECEWFVCGTPLKIKTIGYHSSNNNLDIVYSCEKYIDAILLLEKILRGQLFVDMHLQGLAKQENIQLLMDFMTAHMNNTIIDEQNKNENIANEFLQYCQNLFNSRVIQFTSEAFDDYENDIWLNDIELERIKCLPLKKNVISFLSATTVKKINFTAEPISFIVDDEILEKFKMLEEGQFLEIGDIFEEGEFAFEMKLLKSHSMDPKKCFLFLFLRRMPEWCKSLTVYFDILCLEMKYECVDIWDTFNNVHDYIGRAIFSNDKLANTDSFTVCLCLRI